MSAIWSTDFAGPVLSGIGAKFTPTTSLNLWGQCAQEKTGLHPAPDVFDWWQWNNPLNTTQPWARAVDSGAQPGAHDVKIYRSLADGSAATVATLLNGNYDTIVQSLRENLPASWWSETARNQLGTWGTGAIWCDFVPIGADVTSQLDDIDANTKALVHAAFYGTGTPNVDPSTNITWGSVKGFAALYEARIKAIVAEAIVSPAPGAVDLKPVLDAIAVNDADLDTAIGNLATAINALTAKLAGLTLKAT